MTTKHISSIEFFSPPPATPGWPFSVALMFIAIKIKILAPQLHLLVICITIAIEINTRVYPRIFFFQVQLAKVLPDRKVINGYLISLKGHNISFCS
jgi:hypothetical protein